MRKLILFRVLLVVTAAVIGVFSLLPDTPEIPVKFPRLDKVEHVTAYLFLAFFAAGAFSGNRRRVVLLSLLACCLYGGFLEIMQGYTGRSVEAADFLCDCIGSVAGSLAGRYTR